MARVTIYSEPLVEQFGKGYSLQEQDIRNASGDAFNMAAALTKGLTRLAAYRYSKDSSDPQAKDKHEISVLCGLGHENDDRAKILRKFMADHDLLPHHAITIDGCSSSAYIINKKVLPTDRPVDYEGRGPKSAMCRLLESGAHERSANLALEDIKNNTDIFVITGIGASRARSKDAFQKLVDTAAAVKARGGMVLVDFNHRFHADGKPKLWIDDAENPLPNEIVRERMNRLFALADVTFVAHDELWSVYPDVYTPPLATKQDATDGRPIVDYLRSLPSADSKPRHVIFKRGKEGGSLFYHTGPGQQDEQIDIPGKVVESRDRNGGGDALIGGMVAGLLRGYTLDQSLQIGQLFASKVIQHTGGVIRDDYLPTNSELDEAIQPQRTNHVFTGRAPGTRWLRPDDRATAPQL